jgi:predicted XRE-type DNA-binding protein
MSESQPHDVIEGSGNVFADLQLPEPDELVAKAELVSKISSIIRGRHLTQAQAAEVLGTTQPIVSSLVRGRLDGFSLERLMRFLNALDRDVDIVVKRRSRGRRRARTRVAVSG